MALLPVIINFSQVFAKRHLIILDYFFMDKRNCMANIPYCPWVIRDFSFHKMCYDQSKFIGGTCDDDALHDTTQTHTGKYIQTRRHADRGIQTQTLADMNSIYLLLCLNERYIFNPLFSALFISTNNPPFGSSI